MDENERITVSVLLILRQKKSFPPIKIMPMLASLLYLNNAPAQIASLNVVESTDAGGRMHNNGKSPNLGGFAYPPSCTPNHKKIAPPKNNADARVPEEIGLRRVASLHPYGMRRLPMQGGGRPTSAGGRTNGHYRGLLASPHL